MAAPTSSNEVTVGQLSKVLVGSDGNGGMWKKVKDLAGTKSDTTHTHSVKINGSTKTIAASGGTAVDLGTYLTSHQTIKQDGITGATVNRFGTCSTAAGTAAKTVSITSGTFSLEAGATVAVKFSNANTASTPTLAVGSTAAKNIFVNGAQITTSAAAYGLLKGTVIFIYDGTQYHLIGNYYDSNSTYSGMVTAYLNNAGDAAKAASSTNFKLTTGVTILLTNNAANTKAAALTLNVNSTGAKTLYINGSTSSSSNYTIPAGTYFCHYDGTYWQLWTDGTAQFTNVKAGTFTGNLTGNVTGNCSGSSGSCTGNAATATSAGKLTTARKTYVTLGTASTTTTRDWSGDTTIPVNGTLAVGNGGTGLTTATNVNSVVIGNSSSATGALQTVATASGAFYATGANAKPAFGTLPVAQGGTGQTSLANVSVGSATKATGDGDGNTISSTYLKLSGGTMTGTINTPENNVALNFRAASSSWYTTMSYQSAGNEALVFASAQAATSFMFVNGENSVSNHNSNRWQSLTPGLQIKNNCVSIGKLIGSGVDPTYKLEVNGTVRGESYNINDACTIQYNSTTQSLDFVF